MVSFICSPALRCWPPHVACFEGNENEATRVAGEGRPFLEQMLPARPYRRTYPVWCSRVCFGLFLACGGTAIISVVQFAHHGNSNLAKVAAAQSKADKQIVTSACSAPCKGTNCTQAVAKLLSNSTHSGDPKSILTCAASQAKVKAVCPQCNACPDICANNCLVAVAPAPCKEAPSLTDWKAAQKWVKALRANFTGPPPLHLTAPTAAPKPARSLTAEEKSEKGWLGVADELAKQGNTFWKKLDFGLTDKKGDPITSDLTGLANLVGLGAAIFREANGDKSGNWTDIMYRIGQPIVGIVATIHPWAGLVGSIILSFFAPAEKADDKLLKLKDEIMKEVTAMVDKKRVDDELHRLTLKRRVLNDYVDSHYLEIADATYQKKNASAARDVFERLLGKCGDLKYSVFGEGCLVESGQPQDPEKCDEFQQRGLVPLQIQMASQHLQYHVMHGTFQATPEERDQDLRTYRRDLDFYVSEMRRSLRSWTRYVESSFKKCAYKQTILKKHDSICHRIPQHWHNLNWCVDVLAHPMDDALGINISEKYGCATRDEYRCVEERPICAGGGAENHESKPLCDNRIYQKHQDDFRRYASSLEAIIDHMEEAGSR